MIKSVFDYAPGMDQISEAIPEEIASTYERESRRTVTGAEVAEVLRKDRLTPDDFYTLLSPAAEPYLEQMMTKARGLRRQYFGDNV